MYEVSADAETVGNTFENYKCLDNEKVEFHKLHAGHNTDFVVRD